jgi:hypothetical protein
MDGIGNLYGTTWHGGGTTWHGGAYGNGIVFEITP